MLIKKSDQQLLKIGVLLPQSRQYPKAALNFLNGMKLYFTINENYAALGVKSNEKFYSNFQVSEKDKAESSLIL